MVKATCDRRDCDWVAENLIHFEDALDTLRRHYQEAHPTKWWGGREGQAWRLERENLNEEELVEAERAEQVAMRDLLAIPQAWPPNDGVALDDGLAFDADVGEDPQ